MTKVKVIKSFIDKYNLSRAYLPGEEVLFDEERARHIVRIGLGEIADAQVESVQDTPAIDDAMDSTSPEESVAESEGMTAAPDTIFPEEAPDTAESEEKPKRKPRSKK